MPDVELSLLTDDELKQLEAIHPRDLTYPLSLANELPNTIFAERQRRLAAGLRGDMNDRAPVGRVDDTRVTLHSEARASRGLIDSLAKVWLRSGDGSSDRETVAKELRAALSMHARVMRALDVPRDRLVGIVMDIIDTATYEVLAESEPGIWPRATVLRAQCVRWTDETD
jgi:hypothetical protein